MHTRKLAAVAATVTAAVALSACSSPTDSASPAPSSGTGATPTSTAPAPAIPQASADSATAVLVHGAFADSSSWSGTVDALQGAGYRTVAFADPLRGVANDAAALQSFIDTIKGPVVLVGHSYAGMVISQVAAQDHDVTGLVYVAAFIPEVGESVNSLNTMFEGSQLVPDNLDLVPAPGGLTDVYIKSGAFADVYAGGLAEDAAAVAAATERPITSAALGENATAAAPSSTPKWAIIATSDNAVPTKVQEFMADRAGATVSKVDSGHDVPAAEPLAVAKVIAEAAN